MGWPAPGPKETQPQCQHVSSRRFKGREGTPSESCKCGHVHLVLVG